MKLWALDVNQLGATGAHISGKNSAQRLLLPESVEDYVGSENPVRFIDAFVDSLDLESTGFVRATLRQPGDQAMTLPIY